MSIFDKGTTSIIDGMKVREVPDDEPKFTRIYTDTVDRGIVVSLTAKHYSFGGARSWSGEATSRAGRYILFGDLYTCMTQGG